jgi:hypothetical protein
MREFRFGVIDGSRHSQYWTVKALARPELVITGSRTGPFLHLTMHDDERYSHIKVGPAGTAEVLPWTPPGEVEPGLRRLVRLVFPLAAVRYPPPRRPDRVAWVEPKADENVWTDFTVFHCHGARPNEAEWGHVLGSVTLADGSEACVVVRPITAYPGSFTFVPPDPDKARELMSRPNAGALVHGVNDDGCIWYLHLFGSPRDTENPPAV